MKGVFVRALILVFGFLLSMASEAACTQKGILSGMSIPASPNPVSVWLKVGNIHYSFTTANERHILTLLILERIYAVTIVGDLAACETIGPVRKGGNITQLVTQEIVQ